jgi:ketosteroid isomerase-like protein
MLRLFVFVASLLFALPVAAQSPNAASSDVEAQIRDAEQKYNAAYAANDLPAYFGYLASDFAQWLPSGRTDKASYQQSWTRFITNGGKVLSAELSELQIKVGPSGDSAVASYILSVKTQSARGVSDDKYQETDVWFKRDGAWKVIYLHYSAAPKPREPR